MKSVFPFVFEFFEKSRREKFRHPNWLGVKKIFGSDSAQISCVKSLGHKDFKFWVSSKSETKKFFFSKGPDLWRFSDFQSLDFLKNIKGSPLWKKKIFVSDFDEIQNLKSLWPRDFTHEIWAESEPKIFLTYTLASGQNLRGDLWWRGCFWCLWKAKDQNIYLETNFGHLEVIWYIYMA